MTQTSNRTTVVGVLSPDKQTTESMAEETGTHAGSGAATGLVAGGVLGGIGGWLVGIGAVAIPGVGAIAGALVGMGVPKGASSESTVQAWWIAARSKLLPRTG